MQIYKTRNNNFTWRLPHNSTSARKLHAVSTDCNFLKIKMLKIFRNQLVATVLTLKMAMIQFEKMLQYFENNRSKIIFIVYVCNFLDSCQCVFSWIRLTRRWEVGCDVLGQLNLNTNLISRFVFSILLNVKCFDCRKIVLWKMWYILIYWFRWHFKFAFEMSSGDDRYVVVLHSV